MISERSELDLLSRVRYHGARLDLTYSLSPLAVHTYLHQMLPQFPCVVSIPHLHIIHSTLGSFDPTDYGGDPPRHSIIKAVARYKMWLKRQKEKKGLLCVFCAVDPANSCPGACDSCPKTLKTVAPVAVQVSVPVAPRAVQVLVTGSSLKRKCSRQIFIAKS